MRKLYSNRFLLSVVGLLMVLCYCCGRKEPQRGQSAGAGQTSLKEKAEIKHLEATEAETERLQRTQPVAEQPAAEQTEQASPEKRPSKQLVGQVVAERANIVAKIDDYVITKEQLEKRLMMELRPENYEEYDPRAEPPTAKSVLLKMLAEKAMVMEARKQNYLGRESLRALIKRFKDRELVRSLLQSYLGRKIKVTDAQIQQKLKATPHLSRERAKAMLERAQANKLLSQYYNELLERYSYEIYEDTIKDVNPLNIP